MIVHTQSLNFNADRKLIIYIQSKMDKLDQYCNSIIKTDVFLKCNNSKSKTNKTVEVKLSVPGNNLVVKKVSATFESAVLMAVNSMQRKLKKYKYKLR